MAHTFQWILLPFLILCLIFSLINFKNNWFSINKLTTLLLCQCLVCICLFATKWCVCYDHNLEEGRIDGTFGCMANKYVFLLSIVLTTNTVISYAMFGSVTFSLICLFALTVLQIWILLVARKLWGWVTTYYHKRYDENKTIWEEHKVTLPKSVREYYQKLFHKDNDFTPMGWTQFATSFATGSQDKNVFSALESDYAFKVIDFKEYVRYYFSSMTNEEESEMIAKYNRDYKFLMQINHQNIARILRADRFSTKSGIVKRLVLVTKVATFSLHSYIKQHGSSGVGHHWTRIWFKQVVEAVHFLHCQLNKDQPIAHMNIKPENILLYATTEQADEFSAKLSECGLELYFPKSGQITTDNNQFLIAAPEYMIGRKIARFERMCPDPLASDIFSLGVILVLLIKGEVSKLVEKPEMEKVLQMTKSVNITYADFSWKSFKSSKSSKGSKSSKSLGVKDMFVKKEERHLVHLLKGMLERTPENRFDIISVKNHPWIQTKQN